MRFSRKSALDRRENRLSRLLREVRGRGEVVDLTASNPTAAGIAYDEEAIVRALGDPRAMAYAPEPLGLWSAREAVAAEMSAEGPAVEPERVILTASTSEAYGFLFKLLCDPGDEVLVPAPSYPLLEMLAGFESVQLVPYRLAFDGEWHVDLPTVRSAITDRTRAILAVSPNNPTGSYLKRDELEALGELGLPLVSDEVFAPYPVDDHARRVRSALEAPGRLCFALGGLSKLAGLPQMKLGWMALGGEPDAVAEATARLELIADAWLSVGTPVQVAAPELLAAAAVTREAIRERVVGNLRWLRAQMGPESPVTVPPVEGGWYLPLRVPATRSDDQWAELLLHDHRVLVHPGSFYDFHQGTWLVLSLLSPAFREGTRYLLQSIRND